MDPDKQESKKDTDALNEEKEKKKQELLSNKNLSQEEKKRLRQEKKNAKKNKKETATEPTNNKPKEETKKSQKKGDKVPNQQEAKPAKVPSSENNPARFGKPQKNSTPRRDRVDSSHELPTGLDEVSVTAEEIMEKYYGKLHPEVISVGLKLVAGKINESSIRCLAILRALIKFVKDYFFTAALSKDQNERFTVNFAKKIDSISKFLNRCKPFTSGIEFAFDHVIENFKKISAEVNEEGDQHRMTEEDKIKIICSRLVEVIQSFANMRIINANQVICEEAMKQIKENETILTYGYNYSVKSVFLEAKAKNISFSVIVVGVDANESDSVELIQLLTENDIEWTYCQLNSLPLVGRTVSKVFIGGISMMNNGYLVSKSGTASICCWVKSKMIPVVVCIESYKFSKKAVVHSLIVSEGRSEHNNTLNSAHYDITSNNYIDMVICEMGWIPAVSVSIIKT